MDELILSFDMPDYSLNEGKFIDNFLNFINNIIDKIISFLKNIKNKIKAYLEKNKKEKIDKMSSDINISKITDFEYYVPNRESIKVYLDAIYVESYDRLILKSLNMANRKEVKDLYLSLFAKYPCDTFSDDNNYIYGIIEYLEKVFGSQCRDKADLNKQLAKCIAGKSNIRYTNSNKIKSELSGNKDIMKTSLGKDLQYISDTREFTLNYFNQVTNKTMVNVKKLKKEIEKNANNYDLETKRALARLLRHYMSMITDSDISGAVKGITKMENDILNTVKSWSNKGEN